jgi:glycosyltransferase involved in cell wall biosynthesis
MQPRLHVPGLPHTITSLEYSHCAYTGKIRLMPRMFESVGMDVVYYGVEGSETGCKKSIDIMSKEEQLELLGNEKFNSKSWDYMMYVGSKSVYELNPNLSVKFNEKLTASVKDNIKTPYDIFCCPFGTTHLPTITATELTAVETGIGYTIPFANYRVFESYAWMHWILGNTKEMYGKDYYWVIPNFYDPDEWKLSTKEGKYLLYLGRLQLDKGLQIVIEIAKKMPSMKIVICGKGDPRSYILMNLPNLEYRPPVSGLERSDLLRNAYALLTPTRYVEPFGGVNVEAQMCGTPVLASDFGAFTETVVDGVTGFRCKTLGDWIRAIEEIPNLNRKKIREIAEERFSIYMLSHKYKNVFEQVWDLLYNEQSNEPPLGWYSGRSNIKIR